MLHRHLARQLRKLGLEEGRPPAAAEWQQFLAGVNRTYHDGDRERYTLERSITICSREMQELNARVAWERDQFARLFRWAPVGMVRVELDGLVSDANPAFEDIGGVPGAALSERRLWDIAHPDDAEAIRGLVEAAATGMFPPVASGIRFQQPSGACLFTNVGLALVRDESGQPQCVVAVVEDVTARNRLEDELRHAHKLESVGRLAAGLAQEMSTSLEQVSDEVARLRSALPTDRRGLQATLDEVAHVADILQSMKAFAGPEPQRPGLADLNQALRDTINVASPELKEVADVEAALAPLPPLVCSLGDLHQVFLNLLVNAARAVSTVVGKSGARGNIGVRTQREGDRVVITISDSGPGLPVAVQRQIRAPLAAAREAGGVPARGLDLSRSVVDRHGGTLTFETEPGRGTTFYVRLPLPAESARAGTPGT